MYYEDELYHHGIKGQKWGVRRFQNPDGTRTAAGKERERALNQEGNPDRKRKLKTAAQVTGGVGAAVGTGLAIAKAGKHIDREKLFAQTIKGGKDKPNISPAEKLSKEAGNVASNSGKIYKVVKKAKDVKSGRESKRLSDQELRERINRMNLEKQYEMLVEEDYARGHVTADEILDSVGAVVQIGGSIATMIAVAALIKK